MHILYSTYKYWCHASYPIFPLIHPIAQNPFKNIFLALRFLLLTLFVTMYSFWENRQKIEYFFHNLYFATKCILNIKVWSWMNKTVFICRWCWDHYRSSFRDVPRNSRYLQEQLSGILSTRLCLRWKFLRAQYRLSLF